MRPISVNGLNIHGSKRPRRHISIQKLKAIGVWVTSLISSRKTQSYLLALPIIVLMDQPLKQVLHKKYFARHRTKCSIDIYEFNISFERIKSLRAQVLDEFIAKIISTIVEPCMKWTVFIDGSSNTR